MKTPDWKVICIGAGIGGVIVSFSYDKMINALL